MGLVNGVIVLLVREEKNVFKLVFYKTTKKRSMMLKRDSTEVLSHSLFFKQAKEAKMLLNVERTLQSHWQSTLLDAQPHHSSYQGCIWILGYLLYCRLCCVVP